jgi:hypothetical protein
MQPERVRCRIATLSRTGPSLAVTSRSQAMLSVPGTKLPVTITVSVVPMTPAPYRAARGAPPNADTTTVVML